MKQIATAIQDGGKGGLVRLIDDRGSCFKVISTFTNGVLTGYTSSSVTIKSGSDVRTYDSNGSQISQYITSDDNSISNSNKNINSSEQAGTIKDAIGFILLMVFLYIWYSFSSWFQSISHMDWVISAIISFLILIFGGSFSAVFVLKMFKKL
jgi:hypothetical protein